MSLTFDFEPAARAHCRAAGLMETADNISRFRRAMEHGAERVTAALAQRLATETDELVRRREKANAPQ